MKCKICGSESESYPLCRTCYAKREAGEIIKCVKCGSWHYAGSPCHCEEGFQAVSYTHLTLPTNSRV